MPRGGGRRAGSGGRAPARSPSPGRYYSSRPSPPPPAQPPRKRWGGGGGGGFGSGIGGAIAGSFIGSALGSVLGNAISRRMYEGRNPDTGEWTDPNREDKNPCRKELDYFLTCAKYAEDVSYCKSASDALKRCADRHRDYFEETED